MTDRPDTRAPDDLPDMPVHEGGGGFSLIWLVPVLALAVALGTAWRSFADQGPLIDVRFRNAAGVTVDETELRFRDIGVGLVERVAFSDNLDEVIVSIRVEKDMAPFIDADARFWVVRPEVTAQGVSGLDTVLSGVYIQGVWDGVVGEEVSEFRGLDDAPLLGAEERGVGFRLRSDTALPTAATPILFKGVEVGRIDAARVTPDGSGVETEAVIYEPFAGLVSTSTRFWDISGFSFSVGAGGARLNFTSLASIITGGITFETMGSGGAPLEEGMVFELFPNEDAARDDFLVAGEGASVSYTMVFDENLSGLSPGASVELSGLRVGDVAALSGVVDPERFGDSDVRLLASIRINPERMGLGPDAGEDGLTEYLEAQVRDGLRGQLTNAGLLTGGLKIDLVEVPEAAPAVLDRAAEPYPMIPTVPADVTDVTATAQGLLQRVDDLPVEELLQEAIDFLDAAGTLVSSEDLLASPEELRGTLAALRGVAESDEVQALPGELAALTADLQAVTGRLDTLLADLEEAETAAAITAAVESIGTTADSLPALVEQARSLLATAEDLPLDDLATRASDLLASAETFLGQESTQALPGQAGAALDEVRATVAAVRGVAESAEVQALPGQLSGLTADLQAATARVTALLAEFEEAGTATAITEAVESVGTAADSLPGLVAEAEALVAEARELPLDDLANRASDLLASAEALLARETTQALPDSVTAALDEIRATVGSIRSVTESAEVQALPGQVSALAGDLQSSAARLDGLLAELEEAEAVARLTAAIDAVAATAEGLPDLVAQAEALLEEAAGLPLEDFFAETTAFLDSAEQVLAQDSARALPGEVNATLAEARQTLAELRAGGLVDNANATLASTRQAADALAEASASLPELSERITRLAAQVAGTLDDYGDGGTIGRDLQSAVRQIQSAASAVERLARTLERNPNSLILGR